MVTNESQRILAKMLVSISSNERECNDAKNTLMTNKQYDLNKCFSRLCNKKTGIIDNYSIVDFMRVNSVYCTLIEAEYLIMFNDKDLKGGFNLHDFKRYIGNDKGENSNSNDNFNLPLIYEVEYLLSKVFEAEMNLIRDFLCYLTNLKKRFDFSSYDMFNSIYCKETILKEK